MKIISTLVSVLLIWQGVAWADPDIFRRSDLQPLTLRTLPDRSRSCSVWFAASLLRSLHLLEQDTENHNVPSMFEKVCEEVERGMERVETLNARGALLSKDYEMLKEWYGSLRRRMQAEEENVPRGYFVLDVGGAEYIRYYSENAEFPDVPCRVLADGRIGGRLLKQRVVSEAPDGGLIGFGDPDELYQGFLENPKVEDISKNGVGWMLKGLRERISSSGLDRGTRERIEVIIEDAASARVVLFREVVLPDGEGTAEARGAFLGFNTIEDPDRTQDSVEGKLNVLLREMMPDTIGLSAAVLALIGDDDDILSEYFLHELICPRYGHAYARQIQEILFPENYEYIGGDERAGHRDGELSVILKRVILEGCTTEEERDLDLEFPKKMAEKIRGYGPAGDEPQEAARAFAGYKRWHEKANKILFARLSRAEEDVRTRVTKVLSRMDVIYRYMEAKVRWIWVMEEGWGKIEKVLAGRTPNELFPAERMELAPIAKDLLERHRTLIGEVPMVASLVDDQHIRDTLDILYDIAGMKQVKVEVVAGSEGPAEIPGRALTDSESALSRGEMPQSAHRLGVTETLRNMNWKAIFVSLGLALALSGLLYLILPVNVITMVIATILPLSLFVYFLAKYPRQWKSILLTAAVFYGVFGAFIKVPWMGLSMALILIGRMYVSRGKEHMAAQQAERGVEKPNANKKRGKSQTTRVSRQKEEDLLKKVDISRDVLVFMLKIIVLKNPRNNRGRKKGVSPPQEMTTATVLDAVFRQEMTDDPEPDEETKNTLRPSVWGELDKIKDGYQFDLRNAGHKLANWENEDNHEVSEALGEIKQEISMMSKSADQGEEHKKEMLAMQELIAEYYGIEGERFAEIRRRMILLAAREKVAMQELIGDAHAREYYALGRAEFYFGEHEAAETAFRKAVMAEKNNMEYLLTLAMVQHTLGKYSKARGGYWHSLVMRNTTPDKTELDKLKIQLTELLMKKAEKRIPYLKGGSLEGPAGQIGKRARVNVRTIKKNGKRATVEVTDSRGKKRTLVMYSGDKLNVLWLHGAVQRSPYLEDDHKRVLSAMLSLLEKSPPGFYFFPRNIDDIFGFVSAKDNLIAVHHDFSINYAAIFHELAEYLIDRGDLQCSLSGTTLVLALPGGITEELDVARAFQSLRNDKEAWADWPEDVLNRRENWHYLLRILYRKITPKIDRQFTQSIKERNGFVLFRVGQYVISSARGPNTPDPYATMSEAEKADEADSSFVYQEYSVTEAYATSAMFFGGNDDGARVRSFLESWDGPKQLRDMDAGILVDNAARLRGIDFLDTGRFAKARDYYAKFGVDLEERLLNSDNVFLDLDAFEKMMPYLEKLSRHVESEKLAFTLQSLVRYYDLLIFSHYLAAVDENDLYEQAGKYCRFSGEVVPATNILVPERFTALRGYGNIHEVLDRGTGTIVEFRDFLRGRELGDVILASAFRSDEELWAYIEKRPDRFRRCYDREEDDEDGDIEFIVSFPDVDKKVFSSEGIARIKECLSSRYGIDPAATGKIMKVFVKRHSAGADALLTLQGILEAYTPADRDSFANLAVEIAERGRPDNAKKLFRILRKLVHSGVLPGQEDVFLRLVMQLKGSTIVTVFGSFEKHKDILAGAAVAGPGVLGNQLNFFTELARRYRNAAGLVIEGVLEGVYVGIVSAGLPESEKDGIIEFSDRMNGFSPILYQVYRDWPDREEFLSGIKEAGDKIRNDTFSEKDARRMLKLSGSENERDQYCFLLAIYLTVIPVRDTSWMSKDDALTLVYRSIQRGMDPREAIPPSLRGYHRTVEMATVERRKIDESIDNSDIIDKWMERLLAREGEDSVTMEDLWDSMVAYSKEEADARQLRRTLEAYLRQNGTFQEQLNSLRREGDYYTRVQKFHALIYDTVKHILEPLQERIKEVSRESRLGNLDDPAKLRGGISRAPIDKLEFIIGNLSEKGLLKLRETLGEYTADLERAGRITAIVEASLAEGAANGNGKLGNMNLIQEAWGREQKALGEEISNYQMEKGKKTSVSFRVVKGLPYVTYGMNCGVCIAADTGLWEDDAFFLLSIVDDRTGEVEGFVQLYEHIMKDGRRVLLVPGLDPTTGFLSERDEDEVLNELLKALREIGLKGGYDAVYLPEDEYVYTNRTDLRKAIKRKEFVSEDLGEEINWIESHPKFAVSRAFDISGPAIKALNSAKLASDRLARALMAGAGKDKKIVLALDQGLGEGEVRRQTALLMDKLSEIERSNKDLAGFLDNLEIITGEGAELAATIRNATNPGKGARSAEDFIVVTSRENAGEFAGIPTVAGISMTGENGESLPEEACYHLPIVEVALFALSKHLGWSEKTLRRYYDSIPHAVSLDDMTPTEALAILSGTGTFPVNLVIPDAERMDKEELRLISERIRDILTKA